jgi:hypothetical protein
MSSLSSIKTEIFSKSLIKGLTNLTTTDSISKIESLENIILSMPQVEMPPNHYFGENVYVREIFFKKGTIATGAVQRLKHVSIMLSGHMTIWTPDRGVHDVYGPSITEVNPGMKRAGYAHTDTHWVCAYGINDPDQYCADELLDILSFKCYGDYEEFINRNTYDLLKE